MRWTIAAHSTPARRSRPRERIRLAKAFACFGPGLIPGLLPLLPEGGETLAAEDLEGEGNGTESTDQEERPADGPALVVGKAIREQEADASARQRTSASEQSKFRNGNFSFPHENTSKSYGRKKEGPQHGGSNLHARI